jgi:Domain of unknown function (DUF4926)
MKFELYSRVALINDVPNHHLKKGDVARIVEYFDEPYPGYALEVFDALGETVDVLSVPENYLEPIRHGERLQVRNIEADAL